MTKKQECPCGFPGPHSPYACATLAPCGGGTGCSGDCFFEAVSSAYGQDFNEANKVFREAGWCGHE